MSETALAFPNEVQRSNVVLSHEERVRMFFWCRDQAQDAWQMAMQMKKLNVPNDHYVEEGMHYLFVAQNVYPMTEDRETVSIHDIIYGKEPKREARK